MGRRAILAICAFALALAAVASWAPSEAFADVDILFANGTAGRMADDGSWITGKARTGKWFNDSHYEQQFYVYMPDNQVVIGRCITPGAPAPLASTYNFRAERQSDGWYSVVVASHEGTGDPDQPPLADGTPASSEGTPQDIGLITWQFRPASRVELQKGVSF